MERALKIMMELTKVVQKLISRNIAMNLKCTGRHPHTVLMKGAGVMIQDPQFL